MSTQFKAEVFQNQFLPEDAKQVHAIMTVTAEGGEGVAATPSGGRLFGVICDTSGSMHGPKMHAAKSAITKIVNLLPEDSFFFVVTGSSKASVVFPLTNATPANKERAIASIKAIDAGGGTVISNWLTEALEQFKKMPNAVRQALLLTDGQNDAADEERLKSVLQLCEGVFQCDCRGVGTDWRVKQLQQISNKLYS